MPHQIHQLVKGVFAPDLLEHALTCIFCSCWDDVYL
jgi:hypothetical protein